MKKYILKLINEEIQKYEYAIECAKERIKSRQYNVEACNDAIARHTKKLEEAHNYKRMFIKSINAGASLSSIGSKEEDI
jgi:cellobiose-specific phosphotransferase system component IIA